MSAPDIQTVPTAELTKESLEYHPMLRERLKATLEHERKKLETCEPDGLLLIQGGVGVLRMMLLLPQRLWEDELKRRKEAELRNLHGREQWP